MTGTVVIQILTFNAIDNIRACLRSLEWTKSEPDIFVVVLDNASSEPVGQMINSEFPFVELHINSQNTGFAKGHNEALKHSLKHNPEHLLILNPDTTVDKTALEIMLAKFAGNKSVGLVGPLIKNDDGRIENSINVQLSIWNYLLKIFLINLAAIKTGNKYKKDNFVEAVTGACMLVKTDLIKKIGLFNENFFFYIEDTELCNRVLNAGYKVLFTPDAVISHSHSQSTKSHDDAANWRKTQLYLSTFVYFKLCRSRLQLQALKLLRLSEMRFRILFNLKKDWAKKMLNEIRNFNF